MERLLCIIPFIIHHSCSVAYLVPLNDIVTSDEAMDEAIELCKQVGFVEEVSNSDSMHAVQKTIHCVFSFVGSSVHTGHDTKFYSSELD